MATQKTYESQVLRLCDLAVTSNELRDVSFIDCLILGPGLLAVGGATSVSECHLGGPSLEALFWLVTPEREFVVGPVMAVDCSFYQCRFEGVGFAGPQDLYDKLSGAAQ